MALTMFNFLTPLTSQNDKKKTCRHCKGSGLTENSKKIKCLWCEGTGISDK